MNVMLFTATLRPRSQPAGNGECCAYELPAAFSRRPPQRLRIYGLTKNGEPVDLLPAYAPNRLTHPHHWRWVLPSYWDRGRERWVAPVATTYAILERCRAHGLRARVIGA